MKAKCLRDCWDGQLYRKDEFYVIDPNRPLAVHFQFDKNPGVEQPDHYFDEAKMQYVLLKPGEKPSAPAKPQAPKVQAAPDDDIAAEVAKLRAANEAMKARK